MEFAVEEELLVLGGDHLALVPHAKALLIALVPTVPRIGLGEHEAQLRVATPTLPTIDEVGDALTSLRGRCYDAARAANARLAACGLAPLPNWPGPLGKAPHGASLRITVRTLDPDGAAARLGAALPALLALSASSPYRDGADTGWASARWQATPAEPPITVDGEAVTVRVCDAVPRIEDVLGLLRAVEAVVLRGRPGPVASAAQLADAAQSGVADPRMIPLGPQALPSSAWKRMRATKMATSATRLVVEETAAGLPRRPLVRRPSAQGPDAAERRLLAERPPHHG